MTGRRRLVTLTAVVALLPGCGAATISTAGSQVPSLVVALTTVDSALVHHQYAVARATLVRLIDEARAAASNGSISRDRAARIVSAARELLALLPQNRSTPATVLSQSPTPSSNPTPSRSPSTKATKTAAPHPARPTQRPTATPTPTPSVPVTPTPTPSPTGTVSPGAATSPSP